MDIYLTDEVDIVHMNYDENGTVTKIIESGVKARIEDTNQIIKGLNGKELIANMHIIAKSSQNIKYEDKIKIKKIAHFASFIDQKECEIKKLSRAHGFDLSHWEIWI